MTEQTIAQGSEMAAIDAVAELFRRLGYATALQARLAGIEVDIFAQKGAERISVEVIFGKHGDIPLRKIQFAALRLQSVEASGLGDDAIIAVVGNVAQATKDFMQHGRVRLWDGAALLEKSAPFDDLHETFSSLLSAPEAQPPPAVPDLAQHDLIEKLERHIADKSTLSPKEYEQLCLQTFTFLFTPHLYAFDSQLSTSDGGNRYDFICRVGSERRFWKDLKNDFRTRAILFECKNYQDPVTADQIYSTERYLFAGALRTVCILLARLGGDDGSHRAAQGAMRESGKLILILSNRDMIEMLRLKSEPDGPEKYLDEKIWKFVATLPR